MYFRCPDCLAGTWLDAAKSDDVGTEAICADCDRKHALNASAELGRTVRDHYRNLVDFSNEHDLDMASAYSVLLGIMALEQAQVLRRSRLPDSKAPQVDTQPEEPDPVPAVEQHLEPAPAHDAPEATDEPAFRLMDDIDPGFREAIAEGRMSLQEALKRGDREAFASNLVRRRGLRWSVALQGCRQQDRSSRCACGQRARRGTSRRKRRRRIVARAACRCSRPQSFWRSWCRPFRS